MPSPVDPPRPRRKQRLRRFVVDTALRTMPARSRARVLQRSAADSKVREVADRLDAIAFHRDHARELRRTRDASARRHGGGLVLMRLGRRMTIERSRQQALAWVADVLEQAEIPYFYVPNRINARYRLAVLEDQRAPALAVLRQAAMGTVWYAQAAESPAFLLSRHPDLGDVPSLIVYQNWWWKRSSFRILAGGGMKLEFWIDSANTQVPLADTLASAVERAPLESVFIAPAHNRVTTVVPRAEATPATVTVGERSYPTFTPLTETRYDDLIFPIDVVFTWVDGADTQWQAEKDKWLGRAPAEQHAPRVADRSRFEDHGELMYSLRSVEQFMPWVRHIYVVTADQVPDWLDTSNPKLTMVSHRDIFPAENLPTYNSHALGARLHHIDGLSEHYVYFNDDVMVGRPIRPHLFFEPNGISKFFPTRARYIDPGPPQETDLAATLAAKNNRELIRREFGRTFSLTMRHTAHAQRRSIMAEIEERFSKEYGRTIANRFRGRDDLSVAGSLYHHYAFLTGRAVEGEVTYGYHDIRADTFQIWTQMVRQERPDMFCVNDPGLVYTDIDRAGHEALRFLRRYFPAPSSFERKKERASSVAQ